jgi:hypothetical protein
VPLFFDVELVVVEPACTVGVGWNPGTVMLIAVKLTGAGAFASVRFLFNDELTKTDPPPAPTAVRLGAV